tara:strand:+ start:211 stop:1140 length:930 start_codon:yes stop_codon:yes gene_type:complete
MTNSDIKIPKNPFKYFCDFCDYKSSNKKDFNKHLLTDKHKIMTNDDKKSQKIPLKEFACECGKKYKYRQGLSYHKKKCILLNECTSLITIENKKEIIELKEDNKELKEDNKELKVMIKDLIKENAKQQQQITELIPKIGNNNNNTINNNQKFNINVFLNEKCKDAINMTDFIKSIEVSIQQLDFTKQNGLAHGLSKTIMENMNKLSVYERPLHCTDIKRETLYIKDENEWSKDASKEKIKKAIKKASGKNYNALQDWKTENPDFLVNDSKTDYFTNTIRVIGKTGDATEEKIIKNLCKETYIKNIEENE